MDNNQTPNLYPGIIAVNPTTGAQSFVYEDPQPNYPLAEPVAVTEDPTTGLLYVADEGGTVNQGGIVKIDLSGSSPVATILVSGNGSNGVNGPTSIQIINGLLYVVDRGDKSSPAHSPNVLQIDPNSGAITQVYANSSAPPYGNPPPAGVLVVPNGGDKFGGNVFLGDQKGNWSASQHGTVDEIQGSTLQELATIGPPSMLSTSGEDPLSDGTYPLNADYFTNIQDMKIDAKGNLIVLSGGDGAMDNNTHGSIVNVSYDPASASWTQRLIFPAYGK